MKSDDFTRHYIIRYLSARELVLPPWFFTGWQTFTHQTLNIHNYLTKNMSTLITTDYDNCLNIWLSLESTHIGCNSSNDQSLYTNTRTVTCTTTINTSRTKNYCYLKEKFTLNYSHLEIKTCSMLWAQHTTHKEQRIISTTEKVYFKLGNQDLFNVMT